MQGTIKRLIADRYFGFITGDGLNQDFFFHRDGAPDWDRLREGDAVIFDVSAAPKGPRASDVRRIPG